MGRAVAFGMIGALALTACSEPPDVALSRVTPAREVVTVEGIEFVAELRRGPPGQRLTPMGAVPTRGLGVVVWRADEAPLSNAEGRIAKAAAMKGCDVSGGVYNREALGRYEGAGVWVFDGVCT